MSGSETEVEFSKDMTPEEALEAAKGRAAGAYSAAMQAGDKWGALAVWDEVFAMAPEDWQMRSNLATILAGHGAVEQALELLDRAEALGAPASTLDQFRAAVKGEAPARPDMEYVQHMFDRGADAFDERLASVGYQGPATMELLMLSMDLPLEADYRVLDLGCGTGLCLPHLRPRAGKGGLVGVDISGEMLRLAEARGGYDRLMQGDISKAEDLPEGPFDLVTAAEVFNYFGELRHTFALIHDLLAPAGLFIATFEAAPDGDGPDKDGPGFRLQPSARYQHRMEFVAAEAEAAGLTVALAAEIDSLRKEGARDVPAHGVVFQRAQGAALGPQNDGDGDGE
ncbi:methyltransferase domain-containing protein [Alphaproteobacteria bacterium KMM 3653]|uniref:Methyltransferase domain-containing protein n=1 Tax=Harenicola maris TaxID=2841044 RepID=A0AAP2G6S9_9RHOB|nr:methyltransferase domain-containing protein [Harenicola maris]